MPEVKQARKAKSKKKEAVMETPVRDPEVPGTTEPVATPVEKAPEPKAEAPKATPVPEPPKAEAPKAPEPPRPAPVPKPGQGRLVATPAGRRVYPDINPRILARVAGMLMGINPKDSRFFLEHLASVSRKEITFMVCIRCGTYVPKQNVTDRFHVHQAMMDMRDMIPNVRVLTQAAFNMDLPKKFVSDTVTGVNGFCPRCILEIGSAMPPMFRIPEIENEDAPELRSLILDVIQQQKISEAIILLKRLLQDE
jgi:hypothetical protein